MPQDGIIIGNINGNGEAGTTYTAGSGIVVDSSAKTISQGGQLDGDVDINSNGYNYRLGGEPGYDITLDQDALDISWQDAGSEANGSLHIENSYAEFNHTDGGGAQNFIQMYNELMALFHQDSSGNQSQIQILNNKIQLLFNGSLAALMNQAGFNVPYGKVVGFSNNENNAALSLQSDGVPSGNQNAILKQSGGTIAYISDLANYLVLSGTNQTVSQNPTFNAGFTANANVDLLQNLNVNTSNAGGGGINVFGNVGRLTVTDNELQFVNEDGTTLQLVMPSGSPGTFNVNFRPKTGFVALVGESLPLSSGIPVLAITDAANIGSDAVLEVTGNNMNGLITLTTGSVITGFGDAFSVTMTGYSYPSTLVPVLTPYKSSGPYPLNNQYVSESTSNSYHVGFTSMLLPNTTYQFTYYNGGF